VRAIEPALSEAATGTFTVMLEPEPVIMPPSTVTTVPQVSSAPFWVWVVIGILALLAGLIVALCFTTRR